MLIEILSAIILYCNGLNSTTPTSVKYCVADAQIKFNIRAEQDFSKFDQKTQKQIKNDYIKNRLFQTDVLNEILFDIAP